MRMYSSIRSFSRVIGEFEADGRRERKVLMEYRTDHSGLLGLNRSHIYPHAWLVENNGCCFWPSGP